MKPYPRMAALLLALLLALGCTGCGKKQEPVTVTIWHVYGGETESPLNDLIDTFNETVGRAQNIRVQVGSVTNTNTIHEAVLASAYGEPGATALPDMFVSYPKTVLALPDADILVDYRDYFSDAELDDFIPAFLAEGEIGGHLTGLPVAKSTEILFVDKTLFDRFAAATGATLDDLSTWEGLYRTAEAYTAWTDAQTPDTPDDGKVFFVHDYHFNYFQVGVESLGADFFDGDRVAFGPAFRRVWEMIPMYAHGQCYGDRAEAKDGGPVRARGYEQIQPRVRLQPAQAMQKRLTRNVRQMEQETGCLFQSGCRGDKPEERQRQDDETERRKPEQVDREPEGRAPEGIQHEGEGGELRGDGTAEGQPEKPDETAPGGTHGREPALQDFERREG